MTSNTLSCTRVSRNQFWPLVWNRLGQRRGSREKSGIVEQGRDGTSKKARVESSIFRVEPGTVNVPLVLALQNHVILVLPSLKCVFTFDVFSTGSYATTNGPERGPSAKKCRRCRRFLAHGRKRRKSCRARHGGSHAVVLGLKTLAIVSEQHPFALGTYSDWYPLCSVPRLAALSQDPSPSSPHNACGIQLRATRAGGKGQAHCRQLDCAENIATRRQRWAECN